MNTEKTNLEIRNSRIAQRAKNIIRDINDPALAEKKLKDLRKAQYDRIYRKNIFTM